MKGVIGIVTWDACDYCENYSDENGCEIIGYREPLVEVDLLMEEVVCLDYEAKNE